MEMRIHIEYSSPNGNIDIYPNISEYQWLGMTIDKKNEYIFSYTNIEDITGISVYVGGELQK